MRRKWAADLTLYLPALLISFVIWLIAKQGETETRKIEAQVRLLGVPPNVSTLVNNPKVDLIFPKIFLKNVMEPNALTVVLEPKSIEEWAGVERYGSQSYSITPSMVDTGDLPSSVKVLGVEDVTVQAQLITRVARVQANVEGTPAEGFVMGEAVIEPDQILLTGSPGALDGLERDSSGYLVRTEKLDIRGRTADFNGSVELDPPEGVEAVQETNVRVVVPIREAQVTRVIPGIPIEYTSLSANLRATIVRPMTVTATVAGPRSVVETLTPNSFQVQTTLPPSIEIGKQMIVSLRLGPRDPALEDVLTIRTDESTMTLLFEEKSSPAPTPLAGPAVQLLPDDTGGLLLPEPGQPLVRIPLESPATTAPPDRETSPPAPAVPAPTPSQ